GGGELAQRPPPRGQIEDQQTRAGTKGRAAPGRDLRALFDFAQVRQGHQPQAQRNDLPLLGQQGLAAGERQLHLAGLVRL
ncbi:hypothetical protein, partial [Klebsiella pneumoniae]|uniref:hypothetical protein n=1 Tax=Klebsiella pneumoniae TaxID=573 RepID=UPI0039C22AD3